MLGHYPHAAAATKTLSLCSRVRATSDQNNDNTLEEPTSMKGMLGVPGGYGGTGSVIGYENAFWPAYSVKQSLPSLLQVD